MFYQMFVSTIFLLSLTICNDQKHKAAASGSNILNDQKIELMSQCALTQLAAYPNEYDTSTPTQLDIAFMAFFFDDIDDIEQIMSLGGALNIQMKVPCLKEKAPQLLTNISLPFWTHDGTYRDFFYRPQIMHRNSYDDPALTGSFFETFQAFPFQGLISYYVSGKFVSDCEMSFIDFPFDYQACSMSFTWNIFRSLINVTSVNFSILPAANLPFQKPNSGWKILGKTASYSQMSMFKEFLFTVHVRRRPFYFLFNIITPFGVLSVTQLAVFLLPFGSESRCTFSVTLLLAFIVFQGSVAATVPKTSERIILIDTVTMNSISALAVTFYSTTTAALFTRNCDFYNRKKFKKFFLCKTVGAMIDLVFFMIFLIFLIYADVVQIYMLYNKQTPNI